MGMIEKISGYFKQFAGEVSGSQATYEEGRREVAQGEREDVIHADAAPQFEVSQAGRTNDGMSSAEPRVITGSDDATMHRTPPGAQSPDSDWSVGFDENAPRQDRETQDRETVANYSDTEQLKLFRLIPVAAATDTNWDNAPNQGEVVVRARSSGDARVVAAEAELDYTEIDALPGDGNSTTSASAFRNEKLYTVVDETDAAYSPNGPREVVAGTVRVDNIRPTEL